MAVLSLRELLPEVVLRLWWDTLRMERIPEALEVLAGPCWVSRWVKNSRGDTVGSTARGLWGC